MIFEDSSVFKTVGQIMLGLFFWIMVVKNILVWKFNIERTGAILPQPQFFLIINFTLQFVAGLGLIVDYYTSQSAIVLIFLTVLATIMFHRFWVMIDPIRKNYHMLLFFNNFAIVGALVMLI